jgi:hypothetical protein
LVNWKKVQRPKKLGGLGVLDLELFSRALRQHWLWLQWTDPGRPWALSDAPCDEVDNQLSRSSTTVLLGNGRKVKFWESAWLDGMAPRNVAPRLYKLAWRKKLTVAEDLQNSNWMRGLWRMSTADEIAEFILLWPMIQEVRLNKLEDQIVWRWTTDRSYTSKSAYEIQFLGSYCTISCTAISKARTEGKHHFFAWLWLQARFLLLTSFWFGTGPALQPALCVIKRLKLQRISL